MLPARRSSASRPAMFVFWLVAVMTQLSFNHVSNLIVGTGWFVTLGLALCSMFLVLAVRIPLRRALGLPGYLIAAALIFYVVIGGGVALVTDAGWHMGSYRLSFHVGLAVSLIVASALGASAVLRQSGIECLLIGILVIKAIVCILILTTPVLVENLYHLVPHYQRVVENRFIGPFYGPNYAGIAACQAVVLSLFMSSGRHRIVACLIAILGSAAAIMTFSRAAFLALILVFLFFFLSSTTDTSAGRRSHAAVWLTCVFIICALVLALANAEHLPLKSLQSARVNSIEWIVKYGSTMHDDRFVIWPLGLSVIAESPLWGHGLLQFHYLEGAPLCMGGTDSYVIVCGVHNSFLLLWGEAGIIPAELFLLFIGSLLWAYLRMPRSLATNVVTGWTIVLATDSMFTDDVPWFHWNAFIIGVMCAMTAHVAREAHRRRAARAPEARPASTRSTSYGATPS